MCSLATTRESRCNICGSLKLEGNDRLVHVFGLIPAQNINGTIPEQVSTKESFRWDGWARIDGNHDKSKTFAEQWPPERNNIVTVINVIYFAEKHKITKETIQFLVHSENKEIAAIIDSQGFVRILTRPSRRAEKQIHSRMPITISKDMGRDGFIEYVKNKLNVQYS